tara:strand:- start:319 stop:582 length:264 start_codon:yes stop_codon:yes gene_type:complete
MTSVFSSLTSTLVSGGLKNSLEGFKQRLKESTMKFAFHIKRQNGEIKDNNKYRNVTATLMCGSNSRELIEDINFSVAATVALINEDE